MNVATRRLLEEQIAAVVVLGRGENNGGMCHSLMSDMFFLVEEYIGSYANAQRKSVGLELVITSTR